MTGPVAAARSTELMLTRELLLAVGAAALGEVPDDAWGELTGRGLLGPDGLLSAAVAPTAAAVGSPVVTAQLTAMPPEGAAGADLWVGTARAVLHPAGDGPAAVVSVGRSLLPQLVVRATGLGPRPHNDARAFTSDPARVAAACRGQAAPPWPGDEPVQRPRLWRMTWRADGGPHGDLGVLDLGPQGLWRPAAGQGAELTWSPVTASEVWQELGRLFAAALEDRPAS